MEILVRQVMMGWLLGAMLLCPMQATAQWGDPHWFVPVKPQKILLREVEHAGRTRTIHGYLFRAPAGTGRLLVYGPGCNGADKVGRDYHAEHIKRFHAGGLDVLLLNSISDRGLGEGGNCFINDSDPRFVHTPHISADAVTALAWAIDNGYAAGAVGYFGFSLGSRAGIWLAGETSLRGNTPAALRARNLRFATIALVYPDCEDWRERQRQVGVLGTSLMVWGGDKDELQPAACVNLFPPATRKAEFRERIFADTYHGYGFPGAKRVTSFAGGRRPVTSAPNPQAHEETFDGSIAWFRERLRP